MIKIALIGYDDDFESCGHFQNNYFKIYRFSGTDVT